MSSEIHPLDEYIRTDRLPTVWCSGCGIGIAFGVFIRAAAELNLFDKLVVVSGIGCTGRAAGYIFTDSIHPTHGRAIPVATAIKLVKPELKVAVFSGDGDLFSIGGNHFIHGARRNIDMTVICINNFIYGMTGGQVAPTTPIGSLTQTTPYGSPEPDFNLVALAGATGATFIARWTVAHPNHLKKSIKKAFQRKGFSFIEVIAPCPTQFGRYNRLGTALDQLKDVKKKSVLKHGINPQDAKIDLKEEIYIGEFLEIERPEYSDTLFRTTKTPQKG